MAEQEIEEGQTEKWVKHYASFHQILLVGEGDFSFSLSLANSFGSATHIVASSLDLYDVVIKKYKEAKANLEELEKLGASILHGVDSTKMKLHSDLRLRKFDRIIFNFPHAGFHGKEDNIRLIRMHQNLLHQFFKNARGMLRPNGEIHVSHKTSEPFSHWNIKELAAMNHLELTESVEFMKEDYPGYKNKRGASKRCDEPFPLGKCSTFKFRFSPSSVRRARIQNRHKRRALEEVSIEMGKNISVNIRLPRYEETPGQWQIQKQPLPIEFGLYPIHHKENMYQKCYEPRIGFPDCGMGGSPPYGGTRRIPDCEMGGSHTFVRDRGAEPFLNMYTEHDHTPPWYLVETYGEEDRFMSRFSLDPHMLGYSSGRYLVEPPLEEVNTNFFLEKLRRRIAPTHYREDLYVAQDYNPARSLEETYGGEDKFLSHSAFDARMFGYSCGRYLVEESPIGGSNW